MDQKAMIGAVLVGSLGGIITVLSVLWRERRAPLMFLAELSRLPSDEERDEVLRLLRGESEKTDRARKFVQLTLFPVTLGFAFAVLFYAWKVYPGVLNGLPFALVGGLVGGSVGWLVDRANRRRRRRRLRRLLHDRGVPICVECAYDLTGNVSGVCPECGAEVQERTVRFVRRE